MTVEIEKCAWCEEKPAQPGFFLCEDCEDPNWMDDIFFGSVVIHDL